MTRCLLALVLLFACRPTPNNPSPLPSAEAIVQRQVDAYNAKDLDAFLSFYAEDVVMFYKDSSGNNRVDLKGKAKTREIYGSLFAKNPALHCEIRERRVGEHIVIDTEHITGLSGGGTLDAVVKYKVEEGLIQYVWVLEANFQKAPK